MDPLRTAGGTPIGRRKPVPAKDLDDPRARPAVGLSRSGPAPVRADARPDSADPVPTDDHELYRAVLAGDRERFHEIVHRHAAPLWSTIRRSLRDREEARDVLQETWARALERLPELRDPDRLRAWLVSIAQNLVRERWRRPRPVSVEGLAAGVLAREPGPADCEARDAVAAVRDEIEKLPPRQREVFDLRMNHELSHAEIARLLGITEESSRANHYQALRRLRARFPREDAR